MSDEVKCPQCGEMVSQSVTQCDCGAYVPRTPVLHVDCYCVSCETVREWEQRLVDALNEGNRLRSENEKLREMLTPCRPDTDAQTDPAYPKTVNDVLHLLSCYWADFLPDDVELSDEYYDAWVRHAGPVIERIMGRE